MKFNIIPVTSCTAFSRARENYSENQKKKKKMTRSNRNPRVRFPKYYKYLMLLEPCREKCVHGKNKLKVHSVSVKTQTRNT